MRRHSKLLVAAVLLLLPAIALNAAELTGRVTATVVDEEGNPVADARVEFISPALMGERVQNTDADGRLTSSLLPVGAYAVTVSAPGKQTVTLSLRVGVGQNVPLDVTLKSGEDLVEEVVVYGAATKLETTAGGENFNYDNAIEGLPIQDRDIERVAEFAPNVSFGPTGGTLSISGAPSFDTVVLLDGAEMSDPYFGSAPTLYLEDAVEEVQVLTSGVSARYGRFQGGVISAITKSGGNTFDGTVRYEFSKESWDSQTPFGEDQSDTLTETYQGTLGGYFVKDRLWFFGGYRTIPEEAVSYTTIVTSEGITRSRDEERFQLKLRGAVTPNHVLEASYLEYESNAANRAGLPAYDSLAATGVRSDPRDILTATYQGVLTSSIYLDLIYTDKNVSIQSGGDPANGSPFLYAGNAAPGFGIFHNHWWDFNDPSVRDNENVGANLTQVVSTSDWGEHTLEYGVQYVKSTTGGENRQSSTGYNLLAYDLADTDFVNADDDPLTFNLESYFDTGNQITYRWEALGLGGVQEIENTAAYIQDSWQLNQWRFDVGLRYEEYSGKGPLPTVNIDFKDISPRLAVSYNIDANWQVSGSYGKYISRINDNVASNVTGVGGAPLINTLYTGPALTDLSYDQVEAIIQDDANWDFIVGVYDPSQPTVLLDPDLEAPYAIDVNFAVKRALPRNTGSFTLTYTNREFKNLLDDFVGDEGSVTIVDPDSGAPIDDFDLTRWYNCGECQRDYNAVAATFEYRPGATWNIGGNWTWSETRGNYEGEGRNTPSSGSVIGDYVESTNQQLAAPIGLADEDITHRAAAWGNYRFDFDRFGSLNIGAIARYRSGRVWSQQANLSRGAGSPNYLNDAGTRYVGFFDGRGQNRFSGFWALDMSARYAFPIFRDDVSGWFKVNVINVLNNDELTSFSVAGSSTVGDGGELEWVPASSFGNITSQNNYQTPRTYLFTLGVQF